MYDLIYDKAFMLNTSRVLLSAFLAILFLQSGLDKIFDFKGNLDYIKGQFANGPLSKVSPVLLITLTIIETGAGFLNFAAVLEILFRGSAFFAASGYAAASLSFLALLFGQRMAKDYAGAAVLPPYFLVAIAGLLTFVF